jgi:hypothetical protein
MHTITGKSNSWGEGGERCVGTSSSSLSMKGF